jgi:hypothetical protein
MTSRTVDEFVARVDHSRAWRKKELSELVQALGAATPDSQFDETLRRALALLLNAHWEGLVREAVDLYIVAAKEIGIAEQLKEGLAFRALAAEATYAAGQAREARRLRGKLKKPAPVTHPLADVLLKVEYEAGTLWEAVPLIGDRVGLSMWWNRFEYLCGLVDVPIQQEAGDHAMINARVVQIRHEIAHGGASLPDRDELLEARDRVIALIDSLVEALQDSLDSRRFAA